MRSYIFARSSLNTPITAHEFGRSGPHMLILGGVHGNEPEGVVAAKGLMGKFLESYTHSMKLTLIPEFNVDGVLKHTRKNGRGVDLNRNLPTKDWSRNFSDEKYNPGPAANSEPENQALVLWLEQNKPHMIFSLHSWNPMLNTNGKCKPEAESISRATGYVIKDDIGYPTPGSLGTYCGLERDIPTLTYEIERGLAFEQISTIHVRAIYEALKVFEARFQ